MKTAFPNLNPQNHRLTSPETPDYNCIGWAAEEDDRVWWPVPATIAYWPPGIQRSVSVQCFVDAFATLGYEQCEDGNLELEYQKVVLYTSIQSGEPTHMARQLEDGTWTSKLGQSVDVMHVTPDAVADGLYGKAVKFLRRRKFV